MSSITLRPYQKELVADIYAAWKSNKRVLAQLATGGGKSIILASIVQKFKESGDIVIVIAHRNELIDQLVSTLEKAMGCRVGVIKSGRGFDYNAKVFVASIQSLSPKRMARVRMPGLIVIDESHHVTDKNKYGKVLEHYKRSAKVLGVTATPIRNDKHSLGDVYGTLVQGVSSKYLFDNGYLCRYKLYAPVKSIVKGRVVRGEYDQKDIVKKNQVEDLTLSAVKAYKDFADGRTCIAFCVSVDYSIAQARAYNKAGIPAVHLDGTTDKETRKQALTDLATGKVKVICNYALFGEGVDIPSIEAVQIVRATKSLSLWLQMFGRALRPSPGKEKAIVIDHGENYVEHGTPDQDRDWDINTIKKEVKEKVLKEIAEDDQLELLLEKEVVQIIQEMQLISDPIKLNKMREFDTMIKICHDNSYSHGWLYYQLKGSDYPVECWQALGLKLGRSKGWAFSEYAKRFEKSPRPSREPKDDLPF